MCVIYIHMSMYTCTHTHLHINSFNTGNNVFDKQGNTASKQWNKSEPKKSEFYMYDYLLYYRGGKAML